MDGAVKYWMNVWPDFVNAFVGLAIIAVTIPLMLRSRLLMRLVQRPHDLHHTHTAPISRFGGLALAAAFVGLELFITLYYPERHRRVPGRTAIVVSCFFMFLIGFWDDIK